MTGRGSYTYAPLAISSVTPNTGFAGTKLTIEGTGFLPGALVTLGGIQASNAGGLGSRIRATAPAHDPGAVDVVVTNPGGQHVMLAGGFLYLTVSLTVTPGVVTPGGQLQVSWAIPASHYSDWIGLFIVGGSNFDYLDYQYTNGATFGTQTWTAPAQPGLYEFRYLPNDDYYDVARSSPVMVVGAASAATGGAQTTIRRVGRGGSPRLLEK
ncbi:MAG TPA: IPT/TIG domain-containing protein [Vicinamibacterales bacterium]|nr:IPT/TIG domain-containing protein [Vicinamibacterales bacterium]